MGKDLKDGSVHFEDKVDYCLLWDGENHRMGREHYVIDMGNKGGAMDLLGIVKMISRM